MDDIEVILSKQRMPVTDPLLSCSVYDDGMKCADLHCELLLLADCRPWLSRGWWRRKWLERRYFVSLQSAITRQFKYDEYVAWRNRADSGDIQRG